MNKKKFIVISGINIVEAGPLSIMRDFLEEVSKIKNDSLKVIALVNSKDLFNFPNIRYIEFPKSKKSWLYRIYYEYYYFKKLSTKIKADYWISMHDMTPNVNCRNLYVYCHNVTPYYTPSLKDWRYGSRASLFSLFYIYLYTINIKKNKGIIVQQDWLRNAFKKRFNIKNVIVAYPDIDEEKIETNLKTIQKKKKELFFPSFPRSFKNFEVVCEAYKRLPPSYKKQLKIYLTLSKDLNSYSRYIYEKYNDLDGICFVGKITRKEVFEFYKKVDALVFPSKLESWGLPITEFKKFQKPIFLSDLPYAKETLGKYKHGYFFDPKNPNELTKLLEDFIDDNLEVMSYEQLDIKDPFFVGWKDLFNYIISNEVTE